MNTLKTKLWTAAAAAMMFGSTAMAVDVSGVYVTQDQGQPIGIELRGSGTTVQGAMHYGGRVFPMAAREFNGQLQGTWQAPDGRQIPFAAAMTQSGLTFQTDGVTYNCARSGNGAGQPVGNAPADGGYAGGAVPPAPRTNAPAVTSVQVTQAGAFSIPVPANWQHSGSSNEAWITSPDGSMIYGFVGLERIQSGNVPQFVSFIVNNIYRHRDLQIHDLRPIQYPGATESAEAQISFTHSNGTRYSAWVRVALVQSGGQMNGYMQVVAATPDRFAQAVGQLKGLAEQIQVVDGMGAFDRRGAMKAIQMVRNNPMDHSLTRTTPSSGSRSSSSLDDVNERASDVRRNQFKYTDETTGEEHYVGSEAYDPSRGGVVNPNRPTELLTPEPHWAGRD